MAVDASVAPLVPVGAAWWERRARSVAAALLAVVIALLMGSAILLWAGASPVAAYRDMVRGAIGSRFAISQVLVVLVPLLIIGLGLTVAFRGRVWNIGAEGQFYLGALAGGTIAIAFPWAMPVLAIPIALLAGAAAGAAWGWIAGALRARWGVSEIITSLLLNYVAIYWFGYFIRKPLRDPSGFLPQSREIPEAAQLPDLPALQVHLGLIIGLGLVVILAYVMARTPFGFRVTAMGLSPEAAAGAAGVDTRRSIVRLMLISGGLAGLAGIVQILGVQLRLQVGISPGFGFTAIIVALLGRMRPFGVLLAALLIAGLSVGGQAMQFTQGVPIAAVHTILALFVLFLLVADKLVRR